MTPLEPVVIRALDALGGAFKEGELAYLALTQKVEHAIRDKLAFLLYQALNDDPALLVCREWLRSDLAIIQDDWPRLILEAKALYSFDIIKSGAQHPFPEYVAHDLEKASRWAEGTPHSTPLEVLALVIATHPHTAPSLAYRQAVKYFGGVTRYAIEANNFANADEIVGQRLQDLRRVHALRIPAGVAFGIEVSVFCWLYALNADRA